GAVGSDPLAAGEEWEARTTMVLDLYSTRSPGETLTAWREQATILRDAVARTTDLGRLIDWFGGRAPARDAIVEHAFEIWVHTEDILLGLGRDRLRPADRHLAVMSDLAASLVSLTVENATVRLVLTGGGGGDWLLPLGTTVDATPDL